ncbi:MAG: hypothetical protein AAB610_03265 [Patescibacteria group bacterium]
MNVTIPLWYLPAVFLLPIAIGTLTSLVIRYFRHLCPVEGCRCHTKKTYRLFEIRREPNKRGLKMFWSYKFRICSKGHVTPSIKSIELSHNQVSAKPPHELDWNTGSQLCARSGIPSPFAEPPHLRTTLSAAGTAFRKPFTDQKSGGFQQHIVAS